MRLTEVRDAPVRAREAAWDWNRRKEVTICPTCGTPFLKRSRNNVYCCKECRPSERKEME